MNSRITILIAITLIASGCATGGETGTSGEGPISINSFEASQNPVPGNRNVNLEMMLENTGDAEAENPAVRLFGLTWASESGDEGVWRRQEGDNTLDDADERTIKNDRDMRAPSEDVPTTPERFVYSLISPNLEPGREVDYNFKAKIFYGYQTTGDTSFKLVSAERFREENMERTEATLESSSGPLSFDIRGSTPKVYYTDGAADINDQFCVIVENTGPGTTFLGGETGDPRAYNMEDTTDNQIELTIEDTGNIEFNAVGDESGNENIPVDMINGEKGTQCFEMTSGDDLATQSEQNINTRVIADYNYVKETQTQVTVEGRRTGDEPPEEEEEDDTTIISPPSPTSE